MKKKVMKKPRRKSLKSLPRCYRCYDDGSAWEWGGEDDERDLDAHVSMDLIANPIRVQLVQTHSPTQFYTCWLCFALCLDEDDRFEYWMPGEDEAINYTPFVQFDSAWDPTIRLIWGIP